MTVELDHLFIFTDVGAAEVNELCELGLTEAQGNTHPGQGTACRRVFFHNAYLEFLWVTDRQEAQSERVKPLRLWERWRDRRTTSSPFGIILRPAQGMAEQATPPFETWAYRPSFLQPLQLDVASNASATAEPLLLYMSFGRRPDMYPAEREQPLEHANGVKEITGIKITLPGAGLMSKPLREVRELGAVRFAEGESHLAQVTLDSGKQGQIRDLRPRLPLLIFW